MLPLWFILLNIESDIILYFRERCQTTHFRRIIMICVLLAILNDALEKFTSNRIRFSTGNTFLPNVSVYYCPTQYHVQLFLLIF